MRVEQVDGWTYEAGPGEWVERVRCVGGGTRGWEEALLHEYRVVPVDEVSLHERLGWQVEDAFAQGLWWMRRVRSGPLWLEVRRRLEVRWHPDMLGVSLPERDRWAWSELLDMAVQVRRFLTCLRHMGRFEAGYVMRHRGQAMELCLVRERDLLVKGDMYAIVRGEEVEALIKNSKL
ncbi:MAG: hypothetical protein D6746_16055 [Bacteroidetes bacterium]|nr:MAG: hypothetical protein D6746_16055 [Bacteroidota bacterium]